MMQAIRTSFHEGLSNCVAHCAQHNSFSRRGLDDMQVIDMHCDVLYEMYKTEGKLSFDSPHFDACYDRLIKGGVKVQAFALFIPPRISVEQKFQVALEQIHYFHSKVIAHPKMKQIRELQDIDKLAEDEIGALLTLEGVDAIGADLNKLSILVEAGVRSVGLTWNNANLAADGAGEARAAGLTDFGKEIITFNNDHQILTDVSHLSEKAFWDVMDIADYPIASHSNSRTLCNHVRNLSDEQAKVMFNKNGMIHVVYYPPFVKETGVVRISDLIKHIDHFCSLGGVNHLGLGSDFDGIDQKIIGLEDASKHPNLLNELLKYYSEEQVRGFAYRNFLERRPGVASLGKI